MIIVNEREESVRFFRGALLALGASTMFWGALAGIIYGLEGIPDNWLSQLRNKELLESCLF